MALGASVGVTQAAEQASPYAVIADSFGALAVKVKAPAAGKTSLPMPRDKPAIRLEAPRATAKPSIIAQCGYATISSNFAEDGKTPIFEVSFAEGMVDELVLGGCAQFYKGCNVCSVHYDGCSADEKAACTDTACLEKTCMRHVKCSTKSCNVQSGIPSCKARLARTQCIKKAFD